ncbi:energy transducer TonB [Roseovarius sp. C7]|uniref:energy transducer TonB n=1 Tax=Roseovarius sp. C7 TaxID=3398643 RepID=UPI0039F69797
MIGWLLFGGVFDAEPIPFEVTQVTAISTEDFEALMAAERPPATVSDVTAPTPPQEAAPAAPELSSQADPQTEQSQPDPADPVTPDQTPEPVAPTPRPEVPVDDAAPILPSPPQDTAVLLPEKSLRPKPRPAPRVAPEQVAPPEPETAVDDVVREEAVPDETATTEREETEATAPEEAATEIVTEAEEAVGVAAPISSVRPKTRPSRPTQTAETEPETATETPAPAQTDNSAVEDALAAALGQANEPAQDTEPSGPPLTGGEKDALRVAVQSCWNVGSLSTEALGTTVVVTVDMSEDGKPINGSIKMTGSSGGGDAAARQAYEAARRAIIRCGSRGFDLPIEKYGQWKTIEMTFNPENMRIK